MTTISKTFKKLKIFYINIYISKYKAKKKPSCHLGWADDVCIADQLMHITVQERFLRMG